MRTHKRLIDIVDPNPTTVDILTDLIYLVVSILKSSYRRYDAMKSIIGRKVGMTQVFATDGTSIPVTVIEVLPNVVLQKKTIENDGYEAVQVVYEDIREILELRLSHCSFEKAGTTAKRFVRELKGDD